MNVFRTLILFTALLVIGCAEEPSKDFQFELLGKEDTGLDFENILEQSESFNVFSYMYYFNGGGIAVGDFNQDGLEDLFFTSNMGSNKLFLNEGNLKFKDVTIEAKMQGLPGWTSGACVADVNNDGLPDIYVNQIGDYETIQGHNQLYVNQGIKNGIPVFEDQAAAYGLDLKGFSTQATFFDYDLDGDLDFFQLNHSLHQNGTFGPRKTFQGKQDPYSGDKLFRNDDGTFVEVSKEAGINSTVIGYGLGLAVGDINLDGWPDLYISNDFHENDYLYINQQDGTFSESLNEQMMHTSRFSMGVDLADINNDGWSEVVTLDMLPSDPYILKTSLGEDGFDIFHFKLGFGYNHQYARNMLQLNNTNNTFSEIGLFSGIFATDWSWAPLFMDFDHDGYKDLFISNGIPRRMNDIDYINFKSSDDDLNWKTQNNFMKNEELALVEKMPRIKLKNKFYRNNQSLEFDDLEGAIRNDQTTFSNGAIYADLDNDGDLDIVVNNIEDEPFLYKNLTIETPATEQNYIHLKLKGAPANRDAIGARLLLYKKSNRLIIENYPVRGYQSSVQSGIHAGIGDTTQIDSILLVWPDRSYQSLTTPWNQKINVQWKESLPLFDFNRLREKPSPAFEFSDITQETKLEYVHEENPFVEFNREALMPHMTSTDGPALAVGDVNGDGLEDVFVGSSKRERSQLFLQKTDGSFSNSTPPVIFRDSIFEDVAAVFADIENDGDLDLIIASGGNEYKGKSEARKQRTYLNDGKGNLNRQDLFPEIHMTASCVLAEDFNGDGLVDFFFGGRAQPYNYGMPPESCLMENKGDGVFEEVTDRYHESLKKIGMVKDGAWADFDKDGRPDLILAVEWEAPQIFLNRGKEFERQEVGDWKGWWNFILPADLDGDGDLDLLAGNTGKNSKLKPNMEEPLRLYVNDFDDNGQIEQILTYYLDGQEVPFANFAELTGQMVALKKKYLYAKDFAKASLKDLLGAKPLSKARVLEANTLASAWFENKGDGDFAIHELPDRLQWSSIETAYLRDLDQDSDPEVLLGGNFYECNIEMGRYDANYGNILSFTKDKKMSVNPLGALQIKGQVRRIHPIEIDGREVYILVKNDDALQLVQFEGSK